MSEPSASHAAGRRPRRFSLATLLIVAAIGLGLGAAGAYLALGPEEPSVERAGPGPRWQCPMHPSIVKDRPANCPICGMKLVEVKETAAPAAPSSAAAAAPGTAAAAAPGSAAPAAPAGLAEVAIDPARQQLIGLKTALVDSGLLGGAWRTVGRVAVDERRVRAVNLKVGGFVERVVVDFTGQAVAAGDPLFALYSPELLSAQEEYRIALRAGAAPGAGPAAAALAQAARRRLELWDVPAAALARLEAGGEAARALTFVSPIAGTVTRKDIVEGARLAPGAMPYEITDLSAVWVLADAYESDLPRVAPGMAARFQPAALPGRSLPARVGFVDPVLDPGTRTVKLRLELANPAGELRPGMFGDVTLLRAPRRALRIPIDALLDAGGGEWVVFRDLGEGRFAPVRVEIGERGENYAELLGGLTPGERVVTGANYLVDSESRLRAALAALAP